MISLLKFGASWCKPCQVFSPIIHKVAHEANIKIKEVDADSDPMLCVEHEVTTLPTTLILDEGGTEIDRIVGAYPFKQAMKQVRSHLPQQN